ncbi:MAG: pyruvate carboxylase subunit B [Promicromonosporaceae bacterium]|nr:pyruvate carboxylase subunit B [Promicromonosporaceae bacterium]
MKIGITETVLRDAPQSLIATRLRYSEFEEILPTLDAVGYYSLECWGGATFDACLRYLGEDPWDRLRKIREHCPNTKLQMLLRGQNLLGYKHYADDVVREFLALAIGNGIDIVRIFDALNDLRNLETAVDETRKRGADAQVAIAYTTSPVHTLENYVKMARRIADMGATSICLKDMAGIMSPAACADLVAAIKSEIDLRLHLHSHSTTGLAVMAYLKGVEAGADVIDTAISAFSGGTSQPATESLVYAVEQLGFDTGIDTRKLKAVNDFFRPLRKKFLDEGILDPKVLETDVDSLTYQIPGGMLSNLISQLKSLDQLDKLDAVLKETPKVRADLGYPPLVTPTSQVVGAQATANVLAGHRYQVISNEVRAYLRGEYGAPPGPVSEELTKQALGDAQPVTTRFADHLPPGLEQARIDAGDLATSDEDVLSYALFPEVFEHFVQTRSPSSSWSTSSAAAASPSSSSMTEQRPSEQRVQKPLPPSGNPGLIGPKRQDGGNLPGLGWLDYTITEKYEVDDATAAILMAIVAAHLGVSPEQLSFTSIRER